MSAEILAAIGSATVTAAIGALARWLEHRARRQGRRRTRSYDHARSRRAEAEERARARREPSA